MATVKLSEDGLIELSTGHDGPLCPNAAGNPAHPAHTLHVRMCDAAYEATPRDADGEPVTPELGKVSYELSYGSGTSTRMRLYRAVVSAMDHRYRPVAVEALYFKCGICGLILPANRVPQ